MLKQMSTLICYKNTNSYKDRSSQISRTRLKQRSQVFIEFSFTGSGHISDKTGTKPTTTYNFPPLNNIPNMFVIYHFIKITLFQQKL